MDQFNSGQTPQQPNQQMPPGQPMQQPPVQGGGQFEMPPVGQSQVPGPMQGGQMEPAPAGKSKTWLLIGLLVIVLVLGGVVFASYEGWINIGFLNTLLGKSTTTTTKTKETAKTNDDVRKADLISIKDALKKYYQANQAYPVAATTDKTSDSSSVLKALVPTYLASLPTDPVATRYYAYTSDGKTFTLTAVLDDTTDPAGIKSGNYYLYKVTDTSTETPTSSSSSSTSTTPTTSTTSSK